MSLNADLSEKCHDCVKEGVCMGKVAPVPRNS